MTTPCKNCPFKVGSPMGYDADAMETLDDGYEPRCHSLVGADNIFSEDWPTTQRCVGHDLWESGATGFTRPFLITRAAAAAAIGEGTSHG